MGWLSKAWKGVRKVVKKAARTVKKLAKKIAYAVPGGKQGWDLSTKIGQGVTKVVGKVVNAIGPVGMIALSILAPYAAPLWAAFGAAAAAAGGVMGAIGTAIYTAGTWVAGTIGSMTSGISKAIGTIAEGGFSGLANGSLSKAAEQAVGGFAQAFSGQAGSAAVTAGNQVVNEMLIKEAAGQSIFDQTVSKITGDVAGSAAGDAAAEDLANQAVEQNIELASNQGPYNANDPFAQQLPHSPANSFEEHIASGATNAAPENAVSAYNQVNTTSSVNPTPITESSAAAAADAQGGSLTDKASKLAKAMLAGKSDTQEEMVVSQAPIYDGAFAFGNSSSRGGVGSGGGQFLSQAMLQAMQQQTQRMTRGFGNA